MLELVFWLELINNAKKIENNMNSKIKSLQDVTGVNQNLIYQRRISHREGGLHLVNWMAHIKARQSANFCQPQSQLIGDTFQTNYREKTQRQRLTPLLTTPKLNKNIIKDKLRSFFPNLCFVSWFMLYTTSLMTTIIMSRLTVWHTRLNFVITCNHHNISKYTHIENSI